MDKSTDFNKYEKKLLTILQLKADMFDYICWLEDYSCLKDFALDGQVGDYLVLASDATPCWSKTYADAVRVAMEHDKEIYDATAKEFYGN